MVSEPAPTSVAKFFDLYSSLNVDDISIGCVGGIFSKVSILKSGYFLFKIP